MTRYTVSLTIVSDGADWSVQEAFWFFVDELKTDLRIPSEQLVFVDGEEVFSNEEETEFVLTIGTELDLTPWRQTLEDYYSLQEA